MPTVWISREEAGTIAPALTASSLRHLDRESRFDPLLSSPPTWRLSDGTLLYDELAFRRWLESAVPTEWTFGPTGAYRTPPSEDRLYTYQDADLDTLRGRTYVSESGLDEMLPQVPLWRLRDLRLRGVGPRFLKPSPKKVIYIAEEALDWAAGVTDFSDPMRDVPGEPREPYTPPPRFRSP
jgi:hypothetical protein